jgi:hypothetical protein
LTSPNSSTCIELSLFLKRFYAVQTTNMILSSATKDTCKPLAVSNHRRVYIEIMGEVVESSHISARSKGGIIQ